MKRVLIIAFVSLFAAMVSIPDSSACTGITLRSSDGTSVYARTIEWGGSDLNSQYVVVPRGYLQQSYTPEGINGMKFKAVYGYVGFAVEQKEFIAEGLNEAGLSAGLFYFPSYGKYSDYDTLCIDKCIADLQLVPMILGSCKNIDEVIEKVRSVVVVSVDPRASTVHWRFADTTGRQIVLEIVDGEVNFYENRLGVLTNSPSFEWQMTNLNNYVNLYAGGADAKEIGGVRLAPFGAGSGMLGLPGDVTPPSRFVRAAFYQATAPVQDNAQDAVLQAFQILNNFDIPVGVEFKDRKVPADIPSATQWTSATDVKNRIIYYRTMYNSAIRAIDLKKIDFGKVKYRAASLDETKRQPVIYVKIK